MAVTANFAAGTLTLTGDSPDDPITVSRNAAGEILINGGARFTSQQSTISAKGTIQVKAKTIELTDSQLNASTSGGPGTVGGTIILDGKSTTLTNSQILSTATEGRGGTITITSKNLQNPSSVIDASSQSGTDGAVTINGIIQP